MASMVPIEHFCCQNSDCPQAGVRGGENLYFRGWSGKSRRIRDQWRSGARRRRRAVVGILNDDASNFPFALSVAAQRRSRRARNRGIQPLHPRMRRRHPVHRAH